MEGVVLSQTGLSLDTADLVANVSARSRTRLLYQTGYGAGLSTKALITRIDPGLKGVHREQPNSA